MKKMNKMYEAPKAEVIEMQMTAGILDVSGGTSGSTQNPIGGGDGPE